MAEDFIRLAQNIASKIKEADNLLCVSHYDADGIAAAAIVHRALTRADKKFEIIFVKEITPEVISEVKDNVSECKAKNILFTDIGSGQLTLLKELEGDAKIKIFVADHHKPEKVFSKNIFHLNPHLVGIDGSENISGAGTTYLLMRLLNPENIDLMPFALIGAVGDIQQNEEGFIGLNSNLVEDALHFNLITKKKGLMVFGRRRKPVTQVLANIKTPYLMGISGTESEAAQFLSELGIELTSERGIKSLEELGLENEKKIINGLIEYGYPVEKLLGDIYLLKNGWEINEFSSLLNACGRLEKAHIGLKICLEDDFESAENILKEYGRKISKYLAYVRENLENENEEVILREGNTVIIRARENIHENMIGTVTSILLKAEDMEAEAELIVGMAYTSDGRIKVSARSKPGFNLKLNDIIEELCNLCEGSGGGHSNASGGTIPREKEERFIKLLKEVVKRQR